MDFFETAKEFPLIMQCAFFAFGACIGSFLNVCILRIPRGESVATPPSHCKCGAKIKWFDNIPIISWFVLRGRARCCGGAVSFRYPLVEALTACLFLAVWNAFSPAAAFANMAFVSLMIFCAFVDIDTMTLPDAATVGGTCFAVILSAARPELHCDISSADANAPKLLLHIKSLGISVAGAAVSAGVIYWIRLLAEVVFRREAMGEGDVILLGCIGAFCGWQGGIFALFGGSLIGCAAVLPIAAFRAAFGKKGGANAGGGGLEIPFGPWLALGAVAYIFCAKYVDAYFESLAKIFE